MLPGCPAVIHRPGGGSLTAGVLLVMMLGGTLPVPLYVLWEKQMGFGPLGVTVVFAAYVVGTLAALLVLGDLSDHVGRRIVLAIAVACAAARMKGGAGRADGNVAWRRGGDDAATGPGGTAGGFRPVRGDR
jgi:MFS family permease